MMASAMNTINNTNTIDGLTSGITRSSSLGFEVADTGTITFKHNGEKTEFSSEDIQLLKIMLEQFKKEHPAYSI